MSRRATTNQPRTIVKTRTVMPSRAQEKPRKSKKIIVIAAIAIAYSVGHAGASAPTTHPDSGLSECEVWAGEFLGDEALLNEVGCDYDGQGHYTRAEGECAAAARRNFRHGYLPTTYAFRVRVANLGQRCVIWDDGSWSPE